MEKTENTHEDILLRLDVMVRLLMRMATSCEAPSVTQQILLLHSMGLQASQVAALVGKKVNYVTAVMSQRKGRART